MKREAEPEKVKTALRAQIVYTTGANERRTLIMADKEGNIGGIDGSVDLATYASRYRNEGKKDEAAAAAAAVSSLLDRQLPGLVGCNRTITKVAKLGEEDDATQVFQVDIGVILPEEEKAFFGPGAKLAGPLLDKVILCQSLESGAIEKLDVDSGVLAGSHLREQIAAGEISRSAIGTAVEAAKKAYENQVEIMRHLQTSKGEEYQLFKKNADGVLKPEGRSVDAPVLPSSLLDKMKKLEVEGAEIDRCLKVAGINEPTFQSNVYSVDAIGSAAALKSLAAYSYFTIAKTVADRQTRRLGELAKGDPVDKRVKAYEVSCNAKAQRKYGGDLQKFLKDNKLPTSDEFRRMVQALEAHKDEFLADQSAHLPSLEVEGRSTEEYNKQKDNVKKWVTEESLRQIQLAAEQNRTANDQHVFRVKGEEEPLIDRLVKKTSKSSVLGALTLADRMPEGDEEHSIFDVLDIGAMVKCLLNTYAKIVSAAGSYELSADSTPAERTCYRVVTDPEFARGIVEGVEGSLVTNPDGTRTLDLSGLSKEVQKNMKEKDSKAMEFLIGMVGYAKATYNVETELPKDLPKKLRDQLKSEGEEYAGILARSRAQLEEDKHFKALGQPDRGTADKVAGSTLRTAPPGAAGSRVSVPPGGGLKDAPPDPDASSAVKLIAGPAPAVEEEDDDDNIPPPVLPAGGP